jgi:hypothetical protein
MDPSVKIAEVPTPDGGPIVGLALTTDFDATQESGVGDVARALTGTGPRSFAVTRSGREHVAIFDDVNGLAISKHRLDGIYTWGDGIKGAPPDYASKLTQNLRWMALSGSGWRTHDTMSLWRNRAREVGLTGPLPVTKDDLVGVVADALAARSDLDELPCDFSYGSTLIVKAEHGPLAAVTAKLCDAIVEGTLGVASGRFGLFSTNLFLYDTREETPGIVAEREAAFDRYDTWMAELKPVADRLKVMGRGWYFLGNPSQHGDGQVRYWLNGHTVRQSDGGDRQPFGWFTLDELLDEKTWTN